jgi:transcriptional regulator GlxA family with amidase domain
MRSRERDRIPEASQAAPGVPLVSSEGGYVSLSEYEASPHLQRRIREVQAFMAANLDRDVDLRTIAQEAALSPYYFTRQFTAFVGVPPYRYLINLRIARAMELLRDTELSVTQICHRVGFNSLSHFTTTFHQHTGVSPSTYRRRRDFEQGVHRFGSITEPLTHQPTKRFNT